jgi:hypothetical protein
MPYHYHQREPLTSDEPNRLVSARETYPERFRVKSLLDPGLRMAGHAGRTGNQLAWQHHWGSGLTNRSGSIEVAIGMEHK